MTAYLDGGHLRWASADIEQPLTIRPGEDFAVYVVFGHGWFDPPSEGILISRLAYGGGLYVAGSWGLRYDATSGIAYYFDGIGGWQSANVTVAADQAHRVLLSVDRDGLARVAIDSANWTEALTTEVTLYEDLRWGSGLNLTLGAAHGGNLAFAGIVAEAAVWRGTDLSTLASRQALMSGSAILRRRPLMVEREHLVFCADLRSADGVTGKALDPLTEQLGELIDEVEMSEDAGEVFSHHEELFVAEADQAVDETRPAAVMGPASSATVAASLVEGRRYRVAHVGETRYGRRSQAVETAPLLAGGAGGVPTIVPRGPQGLRVELAGGGLVTLCWSDVVTTSGGEPADYAVYGNGGDGPVDLTSPLTTVAWTAPKSYSAALGALAVDHRWAFVVRARASGGTVTDGNHHVVTCTPRSTAPAVMADPVLIQIGAAVGVWTDPDPA